MSGFLLMIPVILFLFYMGLIFESTGITLLAYGAALVGVLSFIYLLLIIRKVSVRVMIPIEIAERGQDFTMRVEVHNKSILPIGKLSLYVEYGEGHDLKKKKIVLKFRNLPIGNSTWNRVLSIKLPGYYEFKAYKIKIHDLVLLSARRTCAEVLRTFYNRSITGNRLQKKPLGRRYFLTAFQLGQLLKFKRVQALRIFPQYSHSQLVP